MYKKAQTADENAKIGIILNILGFASLGTISSLAISLIKSAKG
jgi:hypothetical protein